MPLETYESKALGGYDHDQYDNVSAAALPASQTPDTLDASASGPPLSHSPDITHSQQPQDNSSHHLPYDQDQVPSSRSYRPESVPAHALPSQSPLYSPRSTRSHSLAASLASGSQSPIRRKPLSPTASPLAVRFSSKGFHHTLPHEPPQPPESGYFSLDSPDLYGLSPGQVQSRNSSEVATSPLPTPLEAESEEE